jgi:predicted amidophosphoribosyltransferase
MAFKRATWHSGLTYKQVCRSCQTEVVYDDYALDFRPWYADGFVYCPKCHTPLRHNENLAVENGKVQNNIVVNESAPSHIEINDAQVVTEGERANFCPKCGKKFEDADNFCSVCGTKR